MSAGDEAPQWLQLARAALEAMLQKNVRAAETVLHQIPPESIPNAMCAWVDAMVSVVGPPSDGRTVRVLWQQVGSDEVQTADEVEPAVRWAGRVIGARVALDREQFEALVASVETPQQWTDGVCRVLEGCSEMIRAEYQKALRAAD